MAGPVGPPRQPPTVVSLRPREVAARYGLTPRRIFRAVALGLFPPPRTFGPRSHYWYEHELEAWEKSSAATAFFKDGAQPPLPFRALAPDMPPAPAPATPAPAESGLDRLFPVGMAESHARTEQWLAFADKVLRIEVGPISFESLLDINKPGGKPPRSD